MSNDTVIKVTLDTNGTLVQGEKEAGALNSQLVRMATNANNASKAMKAAKARSSQPSDLDEYGQARAGGGTGAAGRDFANQARGLGGLVRVYATFAANIFAVSAAFNALSRAADTTNLVKGLDQLGAASGRNLGGLSKQIVEVTDNAVSLREAMTTAAQATAAGMSSKDILRLAQGAKSASQALGIDMADALSRISRGVTKLEPELLDELGIFVRVDKAAQDYAKTLGKSALSLTDVEKRAAFTAAVLTQVEQKFGGLNIPANPYTQLLSSLKDVSTKGLEVINTVLGPLVALLAKSPTGLAVGIAAVAGVLIKQALPAIGEFRDNLRKSSQESAQRAKEINDTFNAFKQSKFEAFQSRLSDEVKKQGQTAEKAILEARNQLENSSIKRLKFAKELAGGKIADVTATQLKEIELARDVATEKAKSAKLDDAQRGKLLQKAQDWDKLAASIRTAQRELDKYNKASDPEYLQMAKKGGMGTHEGQIAIIQERLQRSAKIGSILSNAATNAADLGAVNAYRLLNAELNKADNNLGAISKATTKVRGGLAILATSASTAISAFGMWGAIIGVVISGLTLLVEWGRSNNKQIAATDAAFKALEESGDNVERTLSRISKLDPMERMSLQSISARSNALTDLSNSVSELLDKSEKEISSRNWVSSFTNFISKAWGGSTEQKLTEGVSLAVSKAFEAAAGSGDVEKYLDALATKLNISDRSLESIAKALASKDITFIKSVLKDLDLLAKKAATGSDTVRELSDAFKTSSKNLQDYFASLTSQDPLAKLGRDMISNSNKLDEALKMPLLSLNELVEIATNPSKLALFPPSQAQAIAAISNEFKKAAETVRNYDAEIDKLNKNAEQATKNYTNLISVQTAASANRSGRPATGFTVADPAQAELASKNIREQAAEFRRELNRGMSGTIATLNTGKQNAETVISNAVTLFKDASVSQFEAGAKLVQTAIANGFAKAGVIVQQAYAGLLSGTLGGAKEEGRLAKQDLFLQSNQLKATLNLIKTMQLLDVTMRELKLEEEKKGVVDTRQLQEIGYKQSGLNAERAIIQSTKPYKELMSAANLGKDTGTLGEVFRDVSKRMQGPAEQVASINAKLAELGAQAKGIDIKGIGIEIDKRAEFKAREKQLDIDALDNKKKLLDLEKQSGRISEEEYLIQTNNVQRALDILNYEKERLTVQTQLDKILAAYSKVAQPLENKRLSGRVPLSQQENETLDNYIAARTEASTLIANFDTKERERASTQNIKTNKEEGMQILKGARDFVDSERRYSDEQKSRAMELSSINLSAQREELDILNSKGKFSEDEYNAKRKILDLEELSLSTARQLAEADKSRRDRIVELTRKVSDAGGEDTETGAWYQYQLKQENAALAEQRNLILANSEAKRKNIELSTPMNEKTRKMEEIFTSSIDRMSDAIIDFAFTGKQSFGDMIKSMIMDLIKLEMRMSMQAAWRNMGGFSGLMNIFKGGSGSNLSNSTSLVGGTGADYIIPGTFAKGGMFDNGLQKFAKGGMFTNSVVSSPTLFKFAKGTGMMGEAGPEAIMPLKRGPNGSLGVSGTGGSTQVVVNNYSKEQATAKETVDSRGNTRVEVTIGDMVAGEVQRIGSAAQQSIRNTFGKQPVLIRR